MPNGARQKGAIVMSERILDRHVLDNGLEVVFSDEGNRYFGDYHQVKVIASCRINLGDELQSEYLTAADLAKAREIFGEQVEYRRLLKQMGVAGAEVEAVQKRMIDNYLATATAYMQEAGFAARYVARRLVEHRNRSRLYLAGHDA